MTLPAMKGVETRRLQIYLGRVSRRRCTGAWAITRPTVCGRLSYLERIGGLRSAPSDFGSTAADRGSGTTRTLSLAVSR